MAEKLIVNEFLTFVQNKIDVIDELSIVQICASNFTENELESGKTELYNSLSLKLVQRKGEDKNKKIIKDVIKVLKETDPSEQPVFVAKNLNRLPPVTFDHVDVTRLLKDIVILKTELVSLRNDAVSKTELWDLRTDITKELTDIKCACIRKQNTQQSGTNAQSDKVENRIESTARKESADIMRSSSSSGIVPKRKAPVQNKRRRTTSTDTIVGDLVKPSYRDIARTPQSPHANSDSALPDTNDDNNFTLVSNRKKRIRNRNMFGTAEGSSKLLVADLPSGVYVSRLNKATTANDIKEYIHFKGEDCLDVQILSQKQDIEFSSFKVLVPKQKITVFLQNDFWPAGIIFRRFRERPVNVIKSRQHE